MARKEEMMKSTRTRTHTHTSGRDELKHGLPHFVLNTKRDMRDTKPVFPDGRHRSSDEAEVSADRGRGKHYCGTKNASISFIAVMCIHDEVQGVETSRSREASHWKMTTSLLFGRTVKLSKTALFSEKK